MMKFTEVGLTIYFAIEFSVFQYPLEMILFLTMRGEVYIHEKDTLNTIVGGF